MKKRFVLVQIASLALLSGTIILSYGASNLNNEEDKAIDHQKSVALLADQEISKDIRNSFIKQIVAHDLVIENQQKEIALQKEAEKQKEIAKQKHAVQASSVDHYSAGQTKREEVKLTDRSSRPKGKVIHATLTAYTACDEGMDCRGITYTETKVKEGRTIAVDPKVIPLNSWVYIEGLGYRKAEDIGGAIKSNKIDVYFVNKSDAIKFGKKRNVKVILLDEPPK